MFRETMCRQEAFPAHQDQFLQRWGHALSDQQRKVLRDIGLCRTAALGTHLERCDRCSYETVAYDRISDRPAKESRRLQSQGF